MIHTPKLVNTILKDNIKVLKLVQNSGFKTAVIGGSTIIGSYLNRFFDVCNIFIWDPNKSSESTMIGFKTADHWKKVLNLNLTPDKSRGFTFFNDSANLLHKSHGNPLITACFDIRKDMLDYRIYYLAIDPYEFICDNTPLGIERVFCDGKKISFRKEFFHDIINKVITIYDSVEFEAFIYIRDVYLKGPDNCLPIWPINNKSRFALK
jgi:hypothetical protein